LFLLGVVTLVLLIGVARAFGALWFDFPFSALRRPLATAFGLGAIGALAFTRPRWRAKVAVTGAIALVAAWWLTIRPSNTRDWDPEVAEAPYVEIGSDRIVIHNFRHSDYLSKPISARDGKPSADDDPTFSSLIRKGLPGIL
jgi:hypothetical protein